MTFWAGITTHPACFRIMPLVVLLIAVLGFLPVLGNGFIDWRDKAELVDNAAYRELGWGSVLWMFTHVQEGVYRPLTWLTYSVDYQLWNLDPFGYHLTNLLIHGANSVLLYIAMQGLVTAVSPHHSYSITRWSSMLAVLFFALHPLRVEAIAWASARDYLLSTFFFLAAIHGYLQAVNVAGTQKLGRRWIAWTFVAHLLSILSGSSGVALPVVMILVDMNPSRSFQSPAASEPWSKTRLLEKLPFLGLSLAGIYLAHRLSDKVPALPGDTVGAERVGWLAGLLYQPGFYLWKTAVPYALLPVYELPASMASWKWALACGLLVAGLVLGVSCLRKGQSSTLIFLLCYLALLFVPRFSAGLEIALVPSDSDAYLPSLLFSVILAAALCRLWNLTAEGRNHTLRLRVAAGGIVLALALLGALSWQQISKWRDAEVLWRHSVSADPMSARARQKLAEYLIAQERGAEALQLYQAAARDNPESSATQSDLGRFLVSRGQLQEAFDAYRRALALDSTSRQALLGMGNVLASKGDFVAAMEHYRNVVDRFPSASAHVNLGFALGMQGKIAEAVYHYRAALRLDPTNVNANLNLANIMAAQDALAEAIEHYRAVLRIRPSHSRGHFALANALVRRGSLKEAMDHYQEAINYDPDFSDAYAAVGKLLIERGQADKAVEYLRHAVKLRPGDAETRLKLARELAALGRKKEAVAEYEEAKRLLQATGGSPGAR